MRFINYFKTKSLEEPLKMERSPYTKCNEEFLDDLIEIGDYTYGKPQIMKWDNKTKLTIGKFCSIAKDVTILLGGNHNSNWISTYPFSEFNEDWSVAKNILGHPATKGNITIGNDVWIGFNSTILSGVNIGDGAIIGANSVVAKNVPAYSICVGNPAKIIKYRFKAEEIECLKKIKWWDWHLEKIKENINYLMSDNIETFIKMNYSLCIADSIMFTNPKRIVNPKTWIKHIPFAFSMINKLKPNIIVELGTYAGNSFFAFNQAVDELGLNTKCYAVDTWQGDAHSGFYSESIFQNVENYQKQHYPDSKLLRMEFDEAVNFFEDKSIDLLHIDGLHTYEAVKHDFSIWASKISESGVVLFHDTEVRRDDFGVWRFWEEISKSYSNYNFSFGFGLGILILGSKIPVEFQNLINELNTNIYLSKIYESLGEKILIAMDFEDKKKIEIELNSTLNEKNKELITLQNSIDFKIGQLFLKPLRYLRKLGKR